MIEKAEKFPYYALPADGTDELILYKSIAEAVMKYYEIPNEKQKLSELSGAECLEFAVSQGIEIPPALRNNYMGDLIKDTIAEAEGHPYIYPRSNDLFFVYLSESIRKVVNEHCGIYEGQKKLSELSDEECTEFIALCGIKVPYGMEGEGFGGRVKKLIIQAEEASYSHSGLSNTFSTYLYDVVRKSANEYYGIHYDNYHIEWRPEFEEGFYPPVADDE